MDQFIVPQVKAPVNGDVEISGAKNAVLAVMAAALLADGVSEITNVPHLSIDMIHNKFRVKRLIVQYSMFQLRIIR